MYCDVAYMPTTCEAAMLARQMMTAWGHWPGQDVYTTFLSNRLATPPPKKYHFVKPIWVHTLAPQMIF